MSTAAASLTPRKFFKMNAESRATLEGRRILPSKGGVGARETVWMYAGVTDLRVGTGKTTMCVCVYENEGEKKNEALKLKCAGLMAENKAGISEFIRKYGKIEPKVDFFRLITVNATDFTVSQGDKLKPILFTVDSHHNYPELSVNSSS